MPRILGRLSQAVKSWQTRIARQRTRPKKSLFFPRKKAGFWVARLGLGNYELPLRSSTISSGIQFVLEDADRNEKRISPEDRFKQRSRREPRYRNLGKRLRVG